MWIFIKCRLIWRAAGKAFRHAVRRDYNVGHRTARRVWTAMVVAPAPVIACAVVGVIWRDEIRELISPSPVYSPIDVPEPGTLLVFTFAVGLLIVLRVWRR